MKKRKYMRRKQQVTSAVRPGIDMRDVTDKAIRVFRWIDKNILVLAIYLVIAVVAGLVIGYAVNYLRTYGSGSAPEQSNVIVAPAETIAPAAVAGVATATPSPTWPAPTNTWVPPVVLTDVVAGSANNQVVPAQAVMPAIVPTEAPIQVAAMVPMVTLTAYLPDPSIPWNDGELQRCQQYGLSHVMITTYGNGAGAGGCFAYLGDHWERIFP